MQTYDALSLSLDAIAKIDWLEIVQAIATVITAIIAFRALRGWQKQDKAKREAEFLDALIENIHTYLAEISKPVAVLTFVKIGMASHSPTWDDEKDVDHMAVGAIAYIKKNGQRDAKRLQEALEIARPSLIRLRSLAAKGQVFRFNDYHKCQQALAMTAWQFDRIEALLFVIGSPTLNWQHPEVLQSLKDVMIIDPDEIRNYLAESNIVVLGFATETYSRIYG